MDILRKEQISKAYSPLDLDDILFIDDDEDDFQDNFIGDGYGERKVFTAPERVAMTVADGGGEDDQSVPQENGMGMDEVDAPMFDLNRNIDPSVVFDPKTMYDFTHEKRGYAVIICLEKYDPNIAQVPTRHGAQDDLRKLQANLERLKFDVLVLEQVHATTTNVLKTLEKVAALDHSKSDCFLCVISTHGHEEILPEKDDPNQLVIKDHLYMFDGLLSARQIMEVFSTKKANTLNDKPKLFFIQACRYLQVHGYNDVIHEVDKSAVRAVDVTTSEPMDTKKRFETKAEEAIRYATKYPEMATAIQDLPMEKDFLLSCATPPGYVALRRTDDIGSWYIHNLCQMLEKYADSLDLVSILDRVHQKSAMVDIEAFKHRNGKVMPWLASMLTKDLYFSVRKR